MKNRRHFIFAAGASPLVLYPLLAKGEKTLPEGLMLNLDFESVKDGLIPSKTLFPLYVPLGSLGIEFVNHRHLLAFQQGQGLSIPHSSLLDPDGREWVVSVRVFVLEDGLILSQENARIGYAIYLKNHTVQAVLRTGRTAFTLKEDENRLITKYRKKWVTIELRINHDRAYLLLNRRRVAMVPVEAPFAGDNMRIRLGTHSTLPKVLENKPAITTAGFQGAVSSLKIFRQ